MSCSPDNHLYFFGLFLPSLFFSFLYVAGYPLVLFIVLFRNRVSLDNKKFKFTFGFLYDNFKPNLWWMEIAFICRRILIVAINSLLSEIENQEVIIMTIIFGYFIFFLVFPPYHEQLEVNAEILVNTTILFLIGTGTYYFEYSVLWINLLGIFCYVLCFLYLFVALIHKIKFPLLLLCMRKFKNHLPFRGNRDNEL